jgi:hypothetical protein
MRTFLGLLMIANAGLFFFGALQHAGVPIGHFHEPRIVPATVVETICGAFLVWGGVAALANTHAPWRNSLTGNFVALAGVLLGMIALAAGRGPRTTSNDLYHRIMLILIAVSLFFSWSIKKNAGGVKPTSAKPGRLRSVFRNLTDNRQSLGGENSKRPTAKPESRTRGASTTR